jgi:monoamine oxidase
VGRNRFDCLVIGAGAAGLAAAATLAEGGTRVCILEARDRIGGRILTRIEPDVSIPLELGAEFIHGRAPVTQRWLRRFNTPLVDAAEKHVSVRAGKVVDEDSHFEDMKRGLQRVRRPKSDIAFADFLESPAVRKLLRPATRRFARRLAEGFDAADATRASTFAILDEWAGTSAADAPTFRPQRGYGGLVSAIAADFDPTRIHLHLNTIVNEVQWRRGRVDVRATHFGKAVQFSAARTIVTLPIGVLQQPPQAPNAVRFDPVLRDKQRALHGIASGPVIKIMLTFREAFWEEVLDGKFRDAAFLHAHDMPFPTFWSALPVRTPVLAAWCGGPNAARLAGRNHAEIVEHALASLTMMFGNRRQLMSELSGAHVHDWQSDPFACGAYSYVTVGGAGARAALARPVRGTVFFAGEATDTTGEAATVAGALQSGERAARQALKSLVRRVD